MFDLSIKTQIFYSLLSHARIGAYSQVCYTHHSVNVDGDCTPQYRKLLDWKLYPVTIKIAARFFFVNIFFIFRIIWTLNQKTFTFILTVKTETFDFIKGFVLFDRLKLES